MKWTGNSYSYEYQCDCGNVAWAKSADLKKDVSSGNSTRACKSCSQRIRMKVEMEKPEWKIHQLKMSAKALGKPLPMWNDKEREVASIMHNAKQRCSKNRPYYKNWNGRGIEFRFSSVEDATRWVVDNLGYRPSKIHSIDRIDNDGHYEPGNLRWATRSEQNSNKRAYKVGVTGDRIRRLQRLVDYSYESIRTFIKQGMSDDDIINRVKARTGRKRKGTCV